MKSLYQFLSFPSISTDPTHAQDVADCAQFLADHLTKIGIQDVELIKTSGHPIVYGHYFTDPTRPTVLLYAHYDVQPPDPLDLWASDPFKPTTRGGYLYARGASDDKGQLWCHLEALAYLISRNELGCNVKLLIEGEEEIGSPNLQPFVKRQHQKIAADIALISDTPMFSAEQPSICTSLRGLCYVELTATGPSHDLHSGQNGGAAPNPINALAHIIASLSTPTGRIAIDSLYNRKYPVGKIPPFSDSKYMDEIGTTGLWGQKHLDTLQKLWYEPSLDCHGIWGGYTDPGAKTVIPSKAHAKLSLRLVQDQDPDTVFEQLSLLIKRNTPPGITIDIKQEHGGKPVYMDTTHEAYDTAKDALKSGFGKEPIFTGEGGSIPVVNTFKEILGIESILMGFNLPNDNIHGPNERFKLDCLRSGIESSKYFLRELR